MASTDILSIDPQGDIILVFTSNQADTNTEDATFATRLRVSSSVLRLASPVFAAMLGPRFREGKELSENGTLDLPLPDDDVNIMSIICNVLHLRHEEVPARLSRDELYEVAVYADKYSCFRAIGPIAELWVHKLDPSHMDAERVTALVSTYLLRMGGAFTRIAEGLVWFNDEPIAKAANDAACEGVAVDNLVEALGYLDCERRRVQQDIRQYLEVLIEQYCDLRGTYTKSASECRCPNTYGMEFLRQLRLRHCWPLSVVDSRPIMTTFGLLHGVWQLPVEDDRTKRKLCNDGACFFKNGPWNTNIELTRKLRDFTDELIRKLPRLCLECTLAGDVPQKSACGRGSKTQS